MKVGDLVKKAKFDDYGDAGLGIVIKLGPKDPRLKEAPTVRVCWTNGYGTFWNQTDGLVLVAA